MNELAPYIGTALVIAVGAVAAVILAKYGLRLKRLKHHRTELEFDTAKALAGTVEHLGPRLAKRMIHVAQLAAEDCEVLGVSTADVVDFVHVEAGRHPLLFKSPFVSVPLLFGVHLLLVSWDTLRARIERVLNRQQAYPLNDAWTSCLAVYRRATLLPYRLKGPEQLFTSAQAKRSLTIYRDLVTKVAYFLRVLREQQEEPPDVSQDLEKLLDEAEFSLTAGDIGISIARMEAVLSIAHKLILRFAPRGAAVGQHSASGAVTTVELPKDSANKSVLVVDDEPIILRAIQTFLSDHGFTVMTANTTADALRALVENEFDFVITDLVMMSSLMDGREIALAAKRTSTKTKVVVLTAYLEMSRVADLLKAGVDEIISKNEPDEPAIQRVLAVLRRDGVDDPGQRGSEGQR